MTNLERMTAIASAAFNTLTPTAAQITRCARALAHADGAIAQFDDPAATSAQKLALGVEGWRQVIIRLARAVDQHDRAAIIAATPDPSDEFNS